MKNPLRKEWRMLRPGMYVRPRDGMTIRHETYPGTRAWCYTRRTREGAVIDRYWKLDDAKHAPDPVAA